jgi:hypothetical protein
VGPERIHRIEGGRTLATLSSGHEALGGREVWGVSAREVWIAGGALSHTRDGGDTWTDDGPPRCGGEGIWGSSALDLWTSCSFLVHQSRDGGRSWSVSSFQPQTEESFRVRGSGLDDIWIVAEGEYPAHSTDAGATWEQEEVRPPDELVESMHYLDALWSAGKGWAWAVSGGAVWVRRDRKPWVREVATSAGILAVWGSGRGDVWAVGREGLVLHRP